MCATRVGLIGLVALFCSVCVLGQTRARLQTVDTELVLEAGPEAPRLVSLAVPQQAKWENRTSEVLISAADVSDKHGKSSSKELKICRTPPLAWIRRGGSGKVRHLRGYARMHRG
jgi:hypothetical protein